MHPLCPPRSIKVLIAYLKEASDRLINSHFVIFGIALHDVLHRVVTHDPLLVQMPFNTMTIRFIMAADQSMLGVCVILDITLKNAMLMNVSIKTIHL